MTGRRPPKRQMIPPKARPVPAVPVATTAPAAEVDGGSEITAVDVPRVRREVVEWLTEHGFQHYYQAILADRQQVRPAGPAVPVAKFLATAERARVAAADLWYVDGDLCDLLDSAYPSMPTFAPVVSDLPAPRGFVVFARPIAVAASGDIDEAIDKLMPDARHDPEMLALVQEIVAAGSRIVAASWGPIGDIAADMAWPAGGCFVTFYSQSFVREQRHRNPVFARAAASLPTVTPDNECTFAWWPDGADSATYQLEASESNTSGWARMLIAAFRLAFQANLADTSTVERAPRHERRRGERMGLPERDVRVVRLRPSVRDERDAGAPAGAGRAWKHQWIVQGYWRPRVWVPGEPKPTWVRQHRKGPEGLPLIGGERVNLVGQPKPAK